MTLEMLCEAHHNSSSIKLLIASSRSLQPPIFIQLSDRLFHKIRQKKHKLRSLNQPQHSEQYNVWL
eukprot:scaffold7011_cov56-Cyclotella_meneghiniana.AAC.4